MKSEAREKGVYSERAAPKEKRERARAPQTTAQRHLHPSRST